MAIQDGDDSVNHDSVTTISHFGHLVQFLRTTIGQRLQSMHPELPNLRNITLSSTGLIACLKESGYDLGQSTLTEIEKGRMLPGEPDLLIPKLCGCLGIKLGSDEHQALIQQLAFDIVSRRAGKTIALAAIRRKQLKGTVLDPPNVPQPQIT
jgi:hypothetical protein